MRRNGNVANFNASCWLIILSLKQKHNACWLKRLVFNNKSKSNFDYLTVVARNRNVLSIFYFYSSIPYAPDPAVIKPVEVIEKLGDLSKIDISDAVTKLLSSINQTTTNTITTNTTTQQQNTPSTSTIIPRDPRQQPQNNNNNNSEDSNKTILINDPRKARLLTLGSPTTGVKSTERLSIYEQGGLSVAEMNRDIDLRMVEKDLDLRNPNFGDLDLRSGKCKTI